jgi:hypothetical protein
MGKSVSGQGNVLKRIELTDSGMYILFFYKVQLKNEPPSHYRILLIQLKQHVNTSLGRKN